MGWIGSVCVLTGLSKIGGKKKAPEPPKPVGTDNGLADVFNQPGMEGLNDLREAFGVPPAGAPVASAEVKMLEQKLAEIQAELARAKAK